MIRAVVYARFSTDLQSEKSTEDQIDLCCAFAKRAGMTVVGQFQDKAKSGASLHGRPGLQEMLDFVAIGGVDAVVVEHMDRLSRDMEDMAGLHKRLTFRRVKIVEVNGGEATTLTVGMRAVVAQMFREDNVRKIRRGMSGLLKHGLSAGGKAYGYRPDPTKKGQPIIVEDEARVVQRIFHEYVRGNSPKAISHGLNCDKVPGPEIRSLGTISHPRHGGAGHRHPS